MAFTILLHQKAAKTLEKPEKPEKPLVQRIKKQLLKLGEHPEKVGKQPQYSNFWSMRIGDYRAIYEINTEKHQVIVLFLGHRKKVYDDFSKIF